MKIILFLGAISLAVAKKTFFGDQLLTIYPKDHFQANILRHLNDEGEFVDFWSPAYPNQVQAGGSLDLRVPRSTLALFKTMLKRNRIAYEVKMDDVQAMIDNQVKRSAARGILGNVHGYEKYNDIDTISQWVDDITATYSIASRMSLGTSFEGRDIPMIKISTNENNPAMFVDCGFHAREWISPAFCQCFTRNLLEAYTDPLNEFAADFHDVLNELTIYIVPNVNVDGYAYSWTGDRMWRKTRSTGNSVTCTGVDPNRNCDAGFGGEGSSPLACSDTYHGPYAESEPEVKALANFIRANKNQITAYVTIHSYSQLILYPYSYTYDLPSNSDQLDYYAVAAQQAVKQRYRTRYTYGPGAATIYPAAGGSDDFSYDAGIPLSYTLELRDKGLYGFTLPEDQIAPVCEETTDLMKVLVDGALDVAKGITRT